jgi:hypothetical protein
MGLSVFPASGMTYALQHATSGDAVRWEENCLYYSLHQDGAPGIELYEVREAIRASFDAWEDVPCSYFLIEETALATCAKIGFYQDKGNNNLVVWRTSNWHVDEFHVPNAMALTTLSYDDNSGQILDADIEFNGEEFVFGLDGEPDKADIRNTATHEIGHMLGLDHSTVDGATMNLSALPGDIDKRTLEPDDEEGLCALYPIERDPGVCKKPYCGLDLHCKSKSCAGDKGGGSSVEETPQCAAAPGLGARVTSGVVSFVLAILERLV